MVSRLSVLLLPAARTDMFVNLFLKPMRMQNIQVQRLCGLKELCADRMEKNELMGVNLGCFETMWLGK